MIETIAQLRECMPDTRGSIHLSTGRGPTGPKNVSDGMFTSGIDS